jgi:hypothetical protein
MSQTCHRAVSVDEDGFKTSSWLDWGPEWAACRVGRVSELGASFHVLRSGVHV